MSPVTSTSNPNETGPLNYEADARAKIAVVRAMAADFELAQPRSLTPAERRFVTATPRPFVEKATNFSEAMPSLAVAAKTDAAELRDGEAYANAYDPLIDELEVLRQTIRKALALRRLKSARGARSIYRMGKNYMKVEGGDSAKTQVTEMKKALHRRRSSEPAPPPAPLPTVLPEVNETTE